MTDALPVPVGAPAPLPEVVATAIAMAAARIAAEQQARPPVAPPLTREEVEVIVRAAVVAAFDDLGIDLTKLEGREAFRAVIDHARRSKAFWEKGSGTIWNAVWVALATFLIGAVVKFGGLGGVK